MEVNSREFDAKILDLSGLMGTIAERGILCGYWLGKLTYKFNRLSMDTFPGSVKNHREYTFGPGNIEFKYENDRLKLYKHTTCVAGRDIVQLLGNEDRFRLAKRTAESHLLKIAGIKEITIDFLHALQRMGFDKLEYKIKPELISDQNPGVREFLESQRKKGDLALYGSGEVDMDKTPLYLITHSSVKDPDHIYIQPMRDEWGRIDEQVMTPSVRKVLRAYKENISPLQDLEFAKRTNLRNAAKGLKSFVKHLKR